MHQALIMGLINLDIMTGFGVTSNSYKKCIIFLTFYFSAGGGAIIQGYSMSLCHYHVRSVYFFKFSYLLGVPYRF